MSDKKPFQMHVTETRHFEFEVWAANESEAFEKGRDIWIDAPTTGEWELSQTETEYVVSALSGEPCEYCGPGKSTGLPGNACENCMNTGLKCTTASSQSRGDAE